MTLPTPKLLSAMPSCAYNAQGPVHLPGARGGGEVLFLPTRTLTLLDALCAALPAHTLLAADFDALPDTSLPGVNAPLVATTVRCAHASEGLRILVLPMLAGVQELGLRMRIGGSCLGLPVDGSALALSCSHPRESMGQQQVEDSI